MIGQAEVRAPTWGVYADLKRHLSVADLKASAAATAAVGGAVKPVVEMAFRAKEHREQQPRQSVPTTQTVLLLYQPRTRYALTPKHDTPSLHFEDEVLVKVQAVGLNPIDWKAPDFGFGIPTLPYISGRDFVGTVVHAHPSSPFQPSDLVLAVSTDYRDVRKSAFQQYAVAHTFNICRVPANIAPSAGASLGVAFVAAALSLGICFGVDFSPSGGPDYFSLARSVPAAALPPDVLHEAHAGVAPAERARPGDWVALWGGSSTTSLYVLQLARLAGLRVVAVGDVAKHGARLVERGAALWVDSHDPARAVEIIRGVTGGRLRFAVDTAGRESAARLVEALDVDGARREGARAHLVGLAANPKEKRDGLAMHAVPIKLFHEVPAVGRGTMAWLERLLAEGLLTPPEVVVEKSGLAGVNAALDRMRRGEISGQRLVVELD
ncbi:putative zinc-binding dehydrogenase protein [Neofusicoccum parvum]|nr:putative zinc-binding dehydrogenase protein [Neofusicoccum parvum]